MNRLNVTPSFVSTTPFSIKGFDRPLEGTLFRRVEDKMAPVYKLQYFDSMGVVEPIRYLLSYGGVKFQNIVVKKDVEWPTVKKTVPFGKLPVLMVDDHVLFQSVAISRWLGVKFQLIPADDFLVAELDAIVQTIYDLGMRVFEWYSEVDKTKKAVWYTELDTEYMPSFLKNFEEWIVRRGGYFGGKQVSWADLYFVGIMESIEGMWGTRLLQSKYPNLYTLFTRVQAIPQIKSYIAARPSYTV